MSVPFNNTSPANRADDVDSCIRFKIRRNVDFPHPDGPINAVTDAAGIANDTRSNTLFDPNHADTPTASNPAGPPDRTGGPDNISSNTFNEVDEVNGTPWRR